MVQEEYKQAYQQAVKLLATREHGRKELMGKLSRKGFSPDTLHSVLDRLEQEKFLSDERYVESYIHHRSNRGYGPVRIRKELQDKGVQDGVVRLALEGAQLDWFALARSAREKKFGDDLPGDWKEKARQARFLQYRGFTQDQIQGCIDTE